MEQPPERSDAALTVIREYSSEDRSACLSVFDSNRPRYFTAEERTQFAEWLDKIDRASFSVLEIGTSIVACGGIYHDTEKNCVGLAWGMVRQDLHGRGLGRQLTQFRIDQMNAEFPALEQHMGTSQHTFSFYEKMGFRISKITPKGFSAELDRYDMIRSPTSR